MATTAVAGDSHHLAAVEGSSSTISSHSRHHQQGPLDSVKHKSTATGSKPLPNDIYSITDDELASLYSFQKEIGFGNWGSIWRCTDRNVDRSARKVLAVKLVHRDKSPTTAARVRSLWSEFKILRQFKAHTHPNVLAVSSFIITPSYALLSMTCHPDPLPVHLPEGPRANRYLKGILKGLEFLHVNGVSHNDVKPANVVVSMEGEPVLIDFGFAISYGADWEAREDDSAFWSHLSWGTPEYLSPQRAKAQPHDERLSDLWSVGVTLYEIIVGRTPFERDETEEFLTPEGLEIYYQRTLEARILGIYSISPLFEDLILSLLQPDPFLRLASATEALEHPYFSTTPPPPPARPFLAQQAASPPRPRSTTVPIAASPTKLMNPRVAMLADNATPTKRVEKEEWSPRTAVGKASLGTRRTPGDTPSGGSGKKALKVFEDRVAASMMQSTPNKDGRKVLGDRGANSPTVTMLAKEGKGPRLPLAAAKLAADSAPEKGKGKERQKEKENGNDVTIRRPTLASTRTKLDDIFAPTSATLAPAPKPASQTSTTSRRSAVTAPLDPVKRAALDDFLKAKPVPASIRRERSLTLDGGEALSGGMVGGDFGAPKRLFGDPTGLVVKESVKRETPAKPVKLRKRAPTVSGVEGAKTPASPVLRPVSPGTVRSQPSFLALNEKASEKTPTRTRLTRVPSALKNVFGLNPSAKADEHPLVPTRTRTVSQTFTVVDRLSLALDRDAPFAKEERIQAFREHIDGIVEEARRCSVDLGGGSITGSGMMTLPSPPPFLEDGKRWGRRASIATSSPTSSPEGGMINGAGVRKPILKTALLREYAKAAEDARNLKVRQSFDLRSQSSPVPRRGDRGHTRANSEALSTRTRLRPSAAPSFVSGRSASGNNSPNEEEEEDEEVVNPAVDSSFSSVDVDTTPRRKPTAASIRSHIRPARLDLSNKLPVQEGPRSAFSTTSSECVPTASTSTSASSIATGSSTSSHYFTHLQSKSKPTPPTSSESMFAKFIAATPRVERPRTLSAMPFKNSRVSIALRNRTISNAFRQDGPRPSSVESSRRTSAAHSEASSLSSEVLGSSESKDGKDATITVKSFQKIRRFLTSKKA